LKENIGFQIPFIPVSEVKKVNWNISLHDIRNTVSVFLTTEPTVCKKVELFGLYIAG